MEHVGLCPKFEEAFKILGKRWVGVILRVLSERSMRFNEISEQIPHISQKMLSDRLKDLEENGLVIREVFPDTPVRIVYSVTVKGNALTPVLDQVQNWADKWIEMK